MKRSLRILLILTIAMALPGGAGEMVPSPVVFFWLLLCVVGLLTLGIRAGWGNLSVMAAIIATSNAAYWLSFLLWTISNYLRPPRVGLAPFVAVDAFWVLGFLVLAVYEVIVLVKVGRRGGNTAKVALISLAFLAQFAMTYVYILMSIGGV